MRRAAFLSLVGISADTYKNMVRHQHAPSMSASDLVGEDVAGWADYSIRDVVLTAAAIALNGEGLDKGTACAMAVRGFAHIKSWWSMTGAGNPCVFFGAALAGEETLMWSPVGGPLAEIHKSQIGYSAQRQLGDVERYVAKIVLINLSSLRADIEARARKADLSLEIGDLAII